MKNLNEQFKRHTKDLIKENDDSTLEKIYNLIDTGKDYNIELAFMLAQGLGESQYFQFLEDLKLYYPLDEKLLPTKESMIELFKKSVIDLNFRGLYHLPKKFDFCNLQQ